MRVLSIDPGYDRLGVAVIENDTGKDTLVFSTCLISDRDDTPGERLLSLGTALSLLLSQHNPDCVAIETLFFSKNTKTALGVAEARGMLLYLAASAHKPVYEFSPNTVKLATTGYGKSDKTAVVAMVKRLVQNVPTTALDDEYDAIAIGVTCLAEVGRGR
jgi:crossover junction endodeoxyribonuclease RuvC